jgi:hypothetical protein
MSRKRGRRRIVSYGALRLVSESLRVYVCITITKKTTEGGKNNSEVKSTKKEVSRCKSGRGARAETWS